MTLRFNGPYGPDYLISGLVDELLRRCVDLGIVEAEIASMHLKQRRDVTDKDKGGSYYKSGGSGDKNRGKVRRATTPFTLP